MKLLIKFLATIAISLALIGCTSQPHPAIEVETVTPKIVSEPKIQAIPDAAKPAASKLKANRTLKLIKLLDGGVCKDDEQGVMGVFLLYASPEDFERIKQAKGTEIFKDFEAEIQAFSLHAFKHAVNNTHIAINPFALDQEDARNQVAAELIRKFNAAIQPDIAAFEQKSSLSIDVEPFTRSFKFYIDGCEIDSD